MIQSILGKELDITGKHTVNYLDFNSFQKYGRTLFGQI